MSSYADFIASKVLTPTATGLASMPALAYAQFLADKRERMKRRVYIYALIDPVTDEIRYVGKSIRPMQRLQNHCNEKARTWRTNWIQSLIAAGRRPEVRVLEILDRDDDWKAAEIHWIASLRDRGARLTNCTSGGDGVPNLPPEIRARISAVWRGRKHTPETIAKLGSGMRGKYHSDEHRAKMRAAMTGRVVTWGDKLRHAIEKLKADDVRAIRAALEVGTTQKILAARYSVDKGTISNIKRRVSYGWVE